jgi:glutamine phosphoribosylpyrophosphate amidotransferase
VHRGLQPAAPAFCVFEYINFAREDSVCPAGSSPASAGAPWAAAARRPSADGPEADIVIDVPSSAYFFASRGEELGVPYGGAGKNPHAGAASCLTQEQRELIVRQQSPHPRRGEVRARRWRWRRL